MQLSRSDVHEAVKKGRVLVNGTVVKKKDFYIDEDKDIVYFDQVKVDYREFVYYMLNKPQGFVSAVRDDLNPTVADLIKERKDVFPVGRLDKDTEGLLIMTNNGSFAHLLTSPNYDCVKVYFVRSDLPLNKEQMEEFEKGIQIKDQNNEIFLTKKAKIVSLGTNEYHVHITEGKFHQVKRMFGYFGCEVLFLKRIAHGDLMLDEKLLPGEYRALTDEEIIKLKGNKL